MNHSEQNPLDSLAEEFAHRCRNGDQPSISEYVERYPEHASAIQELFPSVEMMERLKSHKEVEHKSRKERSKPAKRPRELGDFRIVREIGRGGMGVVYEAEQRSLRRRVALKVLPFHRADRGEQHVERFRREAEAAARLHHSNIVPVFGVGENDGHHFYVMQYIDGQGLDQVINALVHRKSPQQENGLVRETALKQAETLHNTELVSGRLNASEFSHDADAIPVMVPADTTSSARLPRARSATISLRRPRQSDPYWSNVATIGLQVAKGLTYAHEQNVLHRDIKPSNLMMDQNGTVWITDFGLAKAAESDNLTKTGDVVGTLRYMAPERFEGRCDVRSEVYSLGLTLYELATHRPAYPEKDRGKVIREILTSAPPQLRSLNENIPRDLETIIEKSIARDPKHRYATARDLADDLLAFLEDRPIRARRTSRIEHAFRWSRRNPAYAIAISLAIALLITITTAASIGYYYKGLALESDRQLLAERTQANKDLREEKAKTLQHLARANAENERAEENVQLAVAALNEILDHMTKSDVVALPTDDENLTTVALKPVVVEKDAAILRSVLKFFDRIAKENDKDLTAERARALRVVGDIHRQLGQFREARRAYESAYAEYRQIASDHPDAIIKAAAALNQIAFTYRYEGNERRAGEQFRRAYNLLTNAKSSTKKKSKFKLQLATTLEELGSPRQRPPSASVSTRFLEESNQLLEELHQNAPENPEYRLALARNLRQTARIRSFSRDRSWPERLAKYRSAILRATKLLEALQSEFPNNPVYNYELALTYAPRAFNMPRPFLIKRDQLEKSLAILEELSDTYPNVVNYKAELARQKISLARICLTQRSGVGESNRLLQEGIEIQKEIIKKYPSAQVYYLVFANEVRMLAEEKLRQQDAEGAKVVLESTIEQVRDTLQTMRSSRRNAVTPNFRPILKPYLLTMSKVYRKLGDQQQVERIQKEIAKINQGAKPFNIRNRNWPPRSRPGRSLENSRPGR